jgi:hypothetical protein
MISSTTRWITALFVLASTLLLLRNLALDSPLMAGDEYAYYSAAQTFPNPDSRASTDQYLPRIYSPVFAGYGRLLFGFSARPELPMKVLNTLAFILTVLLYLALLRSVGGTGRQALAAALLLVTPISSYTAYFMPESTYGLFFALLACIVVVLCPVRLLLGAALAGAVVGTMLLVKPHALALLAAVTLALLAQAVAPRAVRPPIPRLLSAIGVFLVCSYVTLVVLNTALSGQQQFHPLLFVGPVYQQSLAAGASPRSWLQDSRELASILGGHLIVLGALLSPAIAAGVAHLRRLYAGVRPASGDARLWMLICFAAVVGVATVAMTTVFTSVAARSWEHSHLRLQARYYSFFLALFFLIYFAPHPDAGSRQGQRHFDWFRASAIAGAASALLLFLVYERRIIYPFDFPEAFVFSSWQGLPGDFAQQTRAMVALIAIGATALTYGVLAWTGRRAALAYPALVIALFTVGNVGVSGWQLKSSGDNAALRADAQAARQLIAAGSRDRGVVIGPEWNGPLAYCLFNFQSSPRVLVRDPSTALTQADVPAGAHWVLLLGRYRSQLQITPMWQTGQIAFLDLAARLPHGQGK